MRLRLEGTARELINRIQNLRKQSGFEVSDKVRILLPEDEELHRVLSVYSAYIAKEVQAVLHRGADGLHTHAGA